MNGTCPCCFGSYVVKNGVMVLHGYKRPGHGYIIGNCPATKKFPPYEVSVEGTIFMRDVADAALSARHQQLKRLRAGEVKELVGRRERSTEQKREIATRKGVQFLHNLKEADRYETVVVRKDDGQRKDYYSSRPWYDELLDAKIRQTEGEIGQIQNDIVFLNEKISTWKPVDLTEKNAGEAAREAEIGAKLCPGSGTYDYEDIIFNGRKLSQRHFSPKAKCKHCGHKIGLTTQGGKLRKHTPDGGSARGLSGFEGEATMSRRKFPSDQRDSALLGPWWGPKEPLPEMTICPDCSQKVLTRSLPTHRRVAHKFGAIVNRGGKKRTVKNLGWLLRHWQEVESFTVGKQPDGGAYMVAHLRGGGTYESDWASYSIMQEWLKRPVFRDVPVNESSGSGGFGSNRRCVGRHCDDRPTRRFGGARGSDSFFKAYVDAALWSSMDNADESGGEPLDRNYSKEDIAEETLVRMKKDCAAFEKKVDEAGHGTEIAGRDAEKAGHDFWLTRNDHGAGFWDGDWPEDVGEKLTEISKEFGEYDLYIGDDGKIYGSGGREFAGMHRLHEGDEDLHEGEPSGYHDCDCCGETIVGSRLCNGCKKADCEANSEGVYDDCQIPTCPECDTKASLMNDGKWHSNCDDDCENHGKSWEA